MIVIFVHVGIIINGEKRKLSNVSSTTFFIILKNAYTCYIILVIVFYIFIRFLFYHCFPIALQNVIVVVVFFFSFFCSLLDPTWSTYRHSFILFLFFLISWVSADGFTFFLAFFLVFFLLRFFSNKPQKLQSQWKKIFIHILSALYISSLFFFSSSSLSLRLLIIIIRQW